MDIKKYKMMVIAIALIGSFLMFGGGIKKAHADYYMSEVAYYCAYAGFYEGLGEYFSGYSIYYDIPSYQYDAYYSYLAAMNSAYNAALNATSSTDLLWYDAYDYAYTAYQLFDTAAYYAYNAAYYGSLSDAGFAQMTAGVGCYYLAQATFIAGYIEPYLH